MPELRDTAHIGPRGGCTFVALPIIASILAFLIWAISPAVGMGSPGFGTYTPEYLARKAAKDQALRWKELCKGSGRYQAMSEAYSAGRPDPCSGAKEWRP